MKNITKYWFLKDCNLFEKIDKKSLMDMSHLLDIVNVKKGEVLHLNRANKRVVYFIRTGSIKIVAIENGHTRSVLKMGDIFGELDIFKEEDKIDEREKAVVLENGVVFVIETEQMRIMIEKHPYLKNQLIKLHGLKIRKLQRNLEDLLYKDSETRITEFVLNYIKEFGKEKDGRFRVKNLLAHKDIAHMTNTSRQTVSNVLSKLRKNKMLDYNSKEMITFY